LLLNFGDDPSQPSHFLHQFQHDPVHQRVTLPAPRSILSRRSSVRLPAVMRRTYVRHRILSRANVPGISCEHCKRAIESEVDRLPDVSLVKVDVPSKTVTVEGDASDDSIRPALDNVGYAEAI
jgi:copper chaperone